MWPFASGSATQGEIIGVDVLDFVIIGDGGRYYSFKEAGR